MKTVEIGAVDLTVPTTSPEFVDVFSEGLQSIELKGKLIKRNVGRTC